MFKKYLQICSLLEEIGPCQPRLAKIQHLIQNPDFQYDEKSAPHILTDTFLASSYWLDQELFDDSYLYGKGKTNLTAMQKAHLTMTDIGATLLDKGFSLEYTPEEFSQDGKAQLAPYVKTFSEQCHKRRNFLANQNQSDLSFLPRVRASFNKEGR